MKSIDDLKNELKKMLDATEDKEMIGQIATINGIVDKVVDENEKLQNDHRELLNDYKDLIKHTSFKPEGHEDRVDSDNNVVDFSEFLKNYKKEN